MEKLEKKQNINSRSIDSTNAWLGMMIVIFLILFTAFCYQIDILYGNSMILFDILFGCVPVLSIINFTKACIKNKKNA